MAHEYDISHHYLVDFTIEINPEIKTYKVISHRNLNHIDSEKFKCDISNKLHLSALATFGENTTMYNEVLWEALNIHAPIKTRSIKLVQKAPWFDGEYSHFRRLRRKAELSYRNADTMVINLRVLTTKSCIQLSISY